MLSKRIKELASQKAKLAELESAVLAEREETLQRLHLDMGYGSTAELVKALRGAARRAPKRGRRKAVAAKGGKKKRTRAKITPELRAEIETAVRGGGTGASIAKQFGVSLPTVQNIKRAAGLTRKSKD